jgi:(4-(4-[2-(gamma-L-glutamylamino)ethyl]phenoxymethyl)furan-2-yl)methanamine synthase
MTGTMRMPTVRSEAGPTSAGSREPPPAPASAGATLALDIGGANTKAAWVDGESLRTISRPFEVWRDRDALATVLREVAAEVAGGAPRAVAITMTAELSDAFRTKREGVWFVLDAAEDAFGARRLSVLTTGGELVAPAAARARPLDVAAANWVATALAVAEAYPDALLVDVGSTTTDIVPVSEGRIAAKADNDLDRLLAGELVYTGVLRTNLAAIAPRVPVGANFCPVASEYFAISADVHLVLGHLTPEAYECPTPDRRPAAVPFARERIARLVCADVERLGEDAVDAIAAFVHLEQLQQLERAARRVQRALPADAPVIAVGSGAFLAREVAARLGRPVADPPAPWGAAGGAIAPAAALAALLARRLPGPC